MNNELANKPNNNESHRSSFNKPRKQFASHGYCRRSFTQVHTETKSHGIITQ